MSKHRKAPSGPVGSYRTTVAMDHGTITTVTVATKTASVSGVTSLDDVSIMPTGVVKTGLIMGGAHCVTDGEIICYIGNPTAGAITTGSVTYNVLVHKN